MDLGIAATAFVLIFPVELPDKTFVASLVLATRYPPVPVWIGVALAFLVQCLVAVTAGSLISLLPDTLVAAAAGTLFLAGAVLLWRGAASAEEKERNEEREMSARTMRDARGLRAAAASFGVLFLAEWGDLSQLFTVGLVARYNDPVSVFAGSWAALLLVAALAIGLGRTLLRYVRLATIRRVGAVICLTLAGLAVYDVIRSL